MNALHGTRAFLMISLGAAFFMPGRVIGLLVGYLVGWLVGWLLVVCLFVCLFVWLVG